MFARIAGVEAASEFFPVVARSGVARVVEPETVRGLLGEDRAAGRAGQALRRPADGGTTGAAQRRPSGDTGGRVRVCAVAHHDRQHGVVLRGARILGTDVRLECEGVGDPWDRWLDEYVCGVVPGHPPPAPAHAEPSRIDRGRPEPPSHGPGDVGAGWREASGLAGGVAPEELRRVDLELDVLGLDLAEADGDVEGIVGSAPLAFRLVGRPERVDQREQADVSLGGPSLGGAGSSTTGSDSCACRPGSTRSRPAPSCSPVTAAIREERRRRSRARSASPSREEWRRPKEWRRPLRRAGDGRAPRCGGPEHARTGPPP